MPSRQRRVSPEELAYLSCSPYGLNSGRWLSLKSDLLRAKNHALAPNVQPSLEHLLIISDCVTFDSLDADLLDAVASRCGGGNSSVGRSSMRSFRMICDQVRPVGPIASPIITGLDNLAARGMNIHLAYGY
jgi:hypothetical protein